MPDSLPATMPAETPIQPVRPTIQPALPSEADALSALAIRSKGHWDYDAAFLEACRDELRVSPEDIAGDELHVQVACVDEAPVGFYSLRPRTDRTWELEALFVEPALIGQGIGRALLEHAKANAYGLGARRLLIQGDPHAERFYLAAGAVRIGERGSGSVAGRQLPLFRVDLCDPAPGGVPPLQGPSRKGVPEEVARRFLARRPIEGVTFSHNDGVDVVAGPYAGRRGSLISILALEPEVTYLVEMGDATYGDLELPQSVLSCGDRA